MNNEDNSTKTGIAEVEEDEEEKKTTTKGDTDDWNEDQSSKFPEEEDQSVKFPQEEANDWNEEQSSKFPDEEDQTAKFPQEEPEEKKPETPYVIPSKDASQDIVITLEPTTTTTTEGGDGETTSKPTRPTGPQPKNLSHYEGHLIKESSEKTHGHKRFVTVDKVSRKVRLQIWKDKKSKETSPILEVFFVEPVSVEKGTFKTEKKSPTVPKGKEFSTFLKILPSRGKKLTEVILWCDNEKKAKLWQSALNDMVNAIKVQEEERKAQKCNIL